MAYTDKLRAILQLPYHHHSDHVTIAYTRSFKYLLNKKYHQFIMVL